MALKKYKKYKDSGIEWIGDIPDGWEITRLANWGKFLKGRGVSKADLTELGVPVVLYGDIYTKYNIVTNQLIRRTSTETATKSVKIEKGDLLFTASGETKEDIGKCICFLGEGESYASGDVIIFRQKSSNSLFLSYVFNSFGIVIQKAKLSKGEIVVHIYSSQLRNIHFSIPPLSEQAQIANYLDHKTKQIDDLIADKQNLIELLKEERTATINQAVTKGLDPNVLMKDSGIEWLGEIPESWDIGRLGYVTTKIGDGLHGTPEYVDKSEYYFVNGNNIGSGKIQVTEQTKKVDESEYHRNRKILNDRTILMSINGTIGNLAYYDNEKIMLGKSIAYINCIEEISKEFVFFFLLSSSNKVYVDRELSGSTISNLSLYSLNKLPIVNPSLKEQQDIVEYLNKALFKFDDEINKTETQINLLKEYKTALISEVVTGKVDIRDDVLN